MCTHTHTHTLILISITHIIISDGNLADLGMSIWGVFYTLSMTIQVKSICMKNTEVFYR